MVVVVVVVVVFHHGPSQNTREPRGGEREQAGALSCTLSIAL